MIYPNTSPRPRRREAGSTILVGLVIMAIATLGVAAWVSLIAARTRHVETVQTSVIRRVALMNARALASEYMYRNTLTKAGSSAKTIDLPGGLGSVTIPAVTEAALSSTTQPGGFTRVGPANGRGYYTEVPVTASITVDDDGDATTAPLSTSHTAHFLLKSRSPMCAGDLFNSFVPTLSWWKDTDHMGDFRVFGNSAVWASESPNSVAERVRSATHSTYTSASPTSNNHVRVKSLGNTWIPQRNYASIPMTNGDWASENGYRGTLNALNSGTTSSLRHKIVNDSHIVINGATAFDSGRGAVSNGNGRVTITLSNIHLVNVLVGNGTKEIRFIGQDNATDLNAAANRKAIAVFVDQTSGADDLRDVKFYDQNQRRLLFAVRKSWEWEEVDLKFEDADSDPVWRLMIAAENVRMRRKDNQSAGTVSMIGGIMTDRDFNWRDDSSNLLHIYREAQPAFLDRLAPRMAWIEVYTDY